MRQITFVFAKSVNVVFQFLYLYLFIDRHPGVFYMLGDDSPDIHGTNGFTWCPSHKRHALEPILKARF